MDVGEEAVGDGREGEMLRVLCYCQPTTFMAHGWCFKGWGKVGSGSERGEGEGRGGGIHGDFCCTAEPPRSRHLGEGRSESGGGGV